MSKPSPRPGTPGRSKARSYDAKRDEVAQATLSVIAREGLDRASLRGIALELGCSTGVLTHYFRDKEAILEFALQSIITSIENLPVADDAHPITLDRYTDEVAQALPNDAGSRQMWKVWVNFTSASFSRPEQQRRHHHLYEKIRSHWAARLTALVEAGLFAKPIDVEEEATLLFCLLDGIGMQALISPRIFSAARQRALIHEHLSRLPWTASARSN